MEYVGVTLVFLMANAVLAGLCSLLFWEHRKAFGSRICHEVCFFFSYKIDITGSGWLSLETRSTMFSK